MDAKQSTIRTRLFGDYGNLGINCLPSVVYVPDEPKTPTDQPTKPRAICPGKIHCTRTRTGNVIGRKLTFSDENDSNSMDTSTD